MNSAGNLTIPSTANVAWLSGAYGAGLTFNGTGTSTTGAIVNTTQSYSARAWVSLNGLSGYQAALAVNGRIQSAVALGFTPQSNLSFTTYSADSGSTSTTRIGSAAVPVLGRWYAVAATSNGGSGLKSLYVNGALQSTATAKATFGRGRR